VAKKAILVGAQAYREQYGLDSIFLLPTNLYGPRDNFDLETSHVIPALIRKMTEAEDEVVLWGDGSPTREFLYVEDCVEGLVLAAERYDGPDPVNLGAGAEISIRDLADLVADITGFGGRIVWDSTKPGGQPRRSVNASRARELFGFEARTPLREGIERTVAWYRSARPASVGR
jgi:GDP-L-fucose synthase